MDMFPALGAAIWALNNMRSADKKIIKSRAILTNGNEWRMV